MAKFTFTSNTFDAITKHILKWEGKTSKDPRDTAATCSPFAGAYHTNKGITYCTFKFYAPKLKIPVTYDRFIKLTDNEVKLFIWKFAESVQADQFRPSIGASLTEIAWGSGSGRAAITINRAINANGYKLPVNKITADTIRYAALIPEKKLYQDIWKERIRFIESLGSQSKYAMFLKGWKNRINDFLNNIKPIAIFPFFFLAISVSVYLLFKRQKI